MKRVMMLVLPTDWSPRNTSLYLAKADTGAIIGSDRVQGRDLSGELSGDFGRRVGGPGASGLVFLVYINVFWYVFIFCLKRDCVCFARCRDFCATTFCVFPGLFYFLFLFFFFFKKKKIIIIIFYFFFKKNEYMNFFEFILLNSYLFLQ
jgi:hypothetical protein